MAILGAVVILFVLGPAIAHRFFPPPPPGPLDTARARSDARARLAAEQRRIAAEQKANETWRLNSIVSDTKATCHASAERATRLVHAHAEWANQDLIQVICRTIWAGMTSDQLLAAWGKPQAVSSSSTGDQTWVYGAGTFVHLEGRLVMSWQTFSQ